MKTAKPKRPSIFSKEYQWKTHDGPRGNPDEWRSAFKQRFSNAEIAEILKDDSPWGILGIAPGASPEEIKRAYFRRAKETHPDALPAGHPDKIKGDEFKKVNAAYQKLTGE